MSSELLRRNLPLVAWLAIGCGSSASSVEAHSCENVAKAMVVLAMEDNGTERVPEELSGVRTEMTAQCKGDAWSKERRQCLAESKTQEDTLLCPLN